MQWHLLLLAFFLPSMTRAEEIIGGYEAKPHSHPHMAYIEFEYTSSIGKCGGFLIHEKFVLTAAHCFNRTLESQYKKTKVLLGAHNIRKKEKTQQSIRVKELIPHPYFSSENGTNDIMLLQLEKKAKLTKEVQILKLPKGEIQVMPGAMCQLAGWGKVAPDTPTNILHEVEMTVLKDQECEIFLCYDHDIQICVGDPKTPKGPFESDSGGPLMCNNVVQAMVSYGDDYRKESGTNPQVFTKLSPYRAWIEEVMKQYSLGEQTKRPL